MQVAQKLRCVPYNKPFRFVADPHAVWQLIMKDVRKERGITKVLVKATYGATAWIDWNEMVTPIESD